MAVKNSPFLGRLKRIIEKVKLLLSLKTDRWFLRSLMGFSPLPRRLSFKAQQGLLDCTAGATDQDYYEVYDSPLSSTSGVSRTASLASDIIISRTTSDASAGDDIDKRADIFIANFYRHIRMERQLELQSCEDRTLERTRTD